MINIGIIGSGANTNRHIRTLRRIRDVSIAGQYSSDIQEKHVASSNNVVIYTDPDSLFDNCDAVIVTDSGTINDKLVTKALKKAKHVLLYPIMLQSINEAMQFVKLAHEANVFLRVGSIGSINLQGLHRMIPDASETKFIELHYYKCITKTSSVNPILEGLLINAQVIHSLVKGQILSIKAKGVTMAATKPEIVSVRLEFDNGCAVNITCNVVAARDDYQATIVLKDRCIKYDFISNKITSWNIQHKKEGEDPPLIIDNVALENTDPLYEELSSFILSSTSKSKHHIDTENGFEPFVLTEKILEKVRKSVIQYT